MTNRAKIGQGVVESEMDTSGETLATARHLSRFSRPFGHVEPTRSAIVSSRRKASSRNSVAQRPRLTAPTFSMQGSLAAAVSRRACCWRGSVWVIVRSSRYCRPISSDCQVTRRSSCEPMIPSSPVWAASTRGGQCRVTISLRWEVARCAWFAAAKRCLKHCSSKRQPQPICGVLEADKLPTPSAIRAIASECGVETELVHLAIAPSTSIAGSLQVVARSVETAMHKLHELQFDVRSIVSATGCAPLPPPAKPGDVVDGIGRTNDAMLYGATVALWADHDDEAIESVIANVPSSSSGDHGQPFAKVFKQYEYDFYKVDPLLFSPGGRDDSQFAKRTNLDLGSS